MELAMKLIAEESIIKEEVNDTYSSRIDHDRLFKQLLETYFSEFMALFFPDVYQAIDFRSQTFLSQEIFTDITNGERQNIDLLVETKLKGEKAAILIHVESQAYQQKQFPERMFMYFSRLYEKYRRRIIPIAVFSHDIQKAEPDCFEITFPFIRILSFSFYKVELSKRNWRDYIRQNNPVAAALLSKMGYSQQERVQVKKEFLRMLVRLQLDPARMKLITTFFETYLKLSEKEEMKLKEEIQMLPEKEVQDILKLETSWERKGRLEGIKEGKKEGIKEGKMQMVRALLEEGLSIEQIARAAKMTEAEIEDIRDNKN